jgi:DNA-binding transcriptional MerR regulator
VRPRLGVGRIGNGFGFPISIRDRVIHSIRELRDTLTAHVHEDRGQKEGDTLAWSTRELAVLAQTTVNTIRHYHHLGLLAEPERKDNGYKQYGPEHLVRLLRIRRLVGLNVPLSQIRDDGIDGPSTRETLRQLDAELLGSIHRLQQARSDIADSLGDEAQTDTLAGLESSASDLSGSSSSLLHLSGQICDDQAASSMRYMVEVDARVGKATDTLPPDSDDVTRERLARLLAPILVQNLIRCPWLLKSTSPLSRSERVTEQTISEAVTKVYNPAQLDVIARAIQLVQELLQAGSENPCDAIQSVAPTTNRS